MPYYLAEIRLNKTGRKKRSERKMGKRVIKHLAIILLIFVLIFTPIMIISVVVGSDDSDQSEVITDLEDLCEHISNRTKLPGEAFNNSGAAEGQRNALCNKIQAVIHQIEAGAREAAVNKLSNDIENAVGNWIIDPWRNVLIEEVENIIEKILDTEPPVIVEVWIEPEAPAYNETVTVKANVTDEGSGVETVILSYSIDIVNWVNVTMDVVEELYVGEIPAFPFDTTVYHKIYADDKVGNSATAVGYPYRVGDPYAPTVSYVDHSPQSPNYNQSVSVFAEVTEPPSASGVELVILSYWNGSDWTNVTMTPENAFYTATISALPYGTTVQYQVFSCDYAGNWAASVIYSYNVTDKYLPIANIESPPQGSYLAGKVNVIVYVYDDDFDRAELTINGTLVLLWTEVGQHTFDWNTTTYLDSVYTIELTAYDMAGNVAKEKVTVTVDNTPPLVVINAPAEGSYLRDTVLVSVTGTDTNFDRMELYISDIQVQNWTDWGSQNYYWNTINFIDGPYTITLRVYDRAGGVKEAAVEVIVDNTPPTASITSPEDESLLKGTVMINATGDDANFKDMKLYIDDDLKQTWTTPGNHSYGWDTTDYSDGSYTIALKVCDEAENTVEKTIAVNVDNTPPSIGTPSWKPEEPYADKQVNVSVLVSDPAPGSGLKSVTLRYKNKTDGEWQSIEMTETTLGNWTATIPGHSAGENVTFYIESLDNVENSAETHRYSYTVGAPVLPWALYAAVGLGISALVATAIYLWYRRRRKKATARAAASPSRPQTEPAVTLYIPAKTLAGYE